MYGSSSSMKIMGNNGNSNVVTALLLIHLLPFHPGIIPIFSTTLSASLTDLQLSVYLYLIYGEPGLFIR